MRLGPLQEATRCRSTGGGIAPGAKPGCGPRACTTPGSCRVTSCTGWHRCCGPGDACPSAGTRYWTAVCPCPREPWCAHTSPALRNAPNGIGTKGGFFLPSTGMQVMSWRGTQGARRAVAHGFHAVLAPTHFCYLDYRQALGPGQPGAWYALLPLEAALEFDPMAGLAGGPPEMGPGSPLRRSPEKAVGQPSVQAWLEQLGEEDSPEFRAQRSLERRRRRRRERRREGAEGRGRLGPAAGDSELGSDG